MGKMNYLVLARSILFMAGSFQPLINKFVPFFNALASFIQNIAIAGVTAMVGYYKLREVFANHQEDQMFSEKTKKVLIALAFIFLAPTIISVISSFFK
ncbi:hypothetical protein B7939_02020 [Eggerthia catenaformis]|nr:hypothetical protein B7939_02020 [Eggerthia catenaformis]